LESLASAHSVLTEEEREAGVVLVDIGGGTTDLSLFYDGIIRHTAVIPFGGNVVTNDIKEGCSVLFKQAEALKVQFGSAMGNMAREDMVVAIPGIQGWEPKEISFRNLACIIQARMEEIIDYVAHHIQTSGFYDKLGAGIVVTGGGALLKNIAPLIKLKTGLDVRMGRPEDFFTSEIVPYEEMPVYATAIGLLVSSGIYASPRVVEQKLFESPEEAMPKKEEAVFRNTKASTRKARPANDNKYITGDLFNSFKKSIAGMFDEKDMEM
jgi:cell division protein FtsA